MQYIKVEWHHEFVDEPVLLYSELDDSGYETRKIEIYRSGQKDFADEVHATGVTRLSEVPIGPIEEIAAHDEFTPHYIEADEFEAVWREAHAKPDRP